MGKASQVASMRKCENIHLHMAPERRLLVMGISKSDAEAIGCQFEQNAIVYGETGENLELLMLRNFAAIKS
jgi:hypothetical protein